MRFSPTGRSGPPRQGAGTNSPRKQSSVVARGVLYAARALNFSRRVERNTTAVHIRNGDKMLFESRHLRGTTDNSTWWLGFLKGKVVGRLKVYSDSCTIAKEVARPWGGLGELPGPSC